MADAGRRAAGRDGHARSFEAFVERALFLDRDDPVAAWGELRAFQAGLIERLAPAQEIHIEAPGTDLTLERRGPHVGQLRRQAQHAVAARSSPGRTSTPPRASSASRSRPSPRGVVVEDVTLEFREGRVVTRKAERGDALPAGDARHRRRAPAILGELGIGTNFGIDRPIGAILFDEKIGGTVHLALGRSYPETGGTNESVVHWDMICDLRQGGRLSADGETILEDGHFQPVRCDAWRSWSSPARRLRRAERTCPPPRTRSRSTS